MSTNAYSADRLRKIDQLQRAMTRVVMLADDLGYQPLIATMDAYKTAVALKRQAVMAEERRSPRRQLRKTG